MNRGQTSRLQRLTAARQRAVDGDGARQIGSADARWASAQAFGRATIGVIFLFITPLLRVAARVYFRRLSGVGLDRLRPRGPVLLLANHPAAWTDALVLDVVLRRKVHFITYERLFHPWPRGWFLRMFGSLPIRFASEPDAAIINRRTFDHCQVILSRGGAVGFFPEGVSGEDRALLPLKTGAARLVVERIRAGVPVPPIIPVALHYEDRTGFRRDVIVLVGAPIVPADSADDREDPTRMVQGLTDCFAEVMQSLLVQASKAGCSEPRVGAAADTGPARPLVMVIGFLGFLGRLMHAVPLGMVEAVVRQRCLPPQQIALARISLGTVVLLLWYTLLAVLAMGLPLPLRLLLLATPMLGAVACLDFDRRRFARKSGGVRP